MKKIGLFLFAVLALCLTACTAIQMDGQKDGVISLAIGEALASEIRSAGQLRSTAESGRTYEVTASLRGDYSARQSVTVTSEKLAAATFTFEQVPAGDTIILDIAVKSGGIYIWYGNSGIHVVSRGPNKLSIAIGRVSGVLMWKSRAPTSTGSDIFIAPYGNYTSPTQLEYTDPAEGISFCFDNTGNVYVQLGTDKPVNKYGIQQDGSYQTTATATYTTSSLFSHLSYDNTTGNLYGLVDGSQLWKATEAAMEEVQITIDGTIGGFAVHDDTVYGARYVGDDATITVVSYDVNSGSMLGSGTPFKLPAVLGTSPTCKMVFQDGALYLALRKVQINDASNATEADPASHCSVGAIAKVDSTTLSLDTSFGDGGWLGLSTSKVNFSGLTAKDSRSVGPVDFYGGGEDSSVFYGPVGFVAVMPKKLVIADAGFAMSQSGDKVNLTKKTRIVTVDLATLAFDSMDVDNQYYQDDIYASTSDAGYSYIVITN